MIPTARQLAAQKLEVALKRAAESVLADRPAAPPDRGLFDPAPPVPPEPL